MSVLLLASSAIALAMLILHGWRTRYRPTLVGFLITAAVFGFVHSLIVSWVFTHMDQEVQAAKPFFIPEALVGDLGGASVQEVVGWAFAGLLAWTVSEFILRRLPNLRDHLFTTVALSALFMLAICYAMETAAVRVGWWYWSLPTVSPLFGNVNTFAMTAWFSVAPDFVLPFMAFACPPRTRRISGWPWMLLFLPHVLGTLIVGWNTWAHATTIPMALIVVALMLFGRGKVQWGRVEDAGAPRRIRLLPGAALAVFFAVVITADIVGGSPAVDLWTLLPLLMLCLLAWRRLPVSVVTALSAASLAGWWWIGPRALWVLAPVGVFGWLKLMNDLRRPAWLKAASAAVTVGLCALVVYVNAAERESARRYTDAWAESERTGSPWQRAQDLRPDDALVLYCAIQRMADAPPETFRRRVPRILSELEEVSRRDPAWMLPREDLAHLHLLFGEPAQAAEQLREILRWQPKNRDVRRRLARLEAPSPGGLSPFPPFEKGTVPAPEALTAISARHRAWSQARGTVPFSAVRKGDCPLSQESIRKEE